MNVLQRLIEEINLILRGAQGYGAGHPMSKKQNTVLGKSDVQEFIEQYDEENKEDKEEQQVKISRFFLDKEDHDQEVKSVFNR